MVRLDHVVFLVLLLVLLIPTTYAFPKAKVIFSEPPLPGSTVELSIHAFSDTSGDPKPVYILCVDSNNIFDAIKIDLGKRAIQKGYNVFNTKMKIPYRNSTLFCRLMYADKVLAVFTLKLYPPMRVEWIDERTLYIVPIDRSIVGAEVIHYVDGKIYEKKTLTSDGVEVFLQDGRNEIYVGNIKIADREIGGLDVTGAVVIILSIIFVYYIISQIRGASKGEEIEVITFLLPKIEEKETYVTVGIDTLLKHMKNLIPSTQAYPISEINNILQKLTGYKVSHTSTLEVVFELEKRGLIKTVTLYSPLEGNYQIYVDPHPMPYMSPLHKAMVYEVSRLLGFNGAMVDVERQPRSPRPDILATIGTRDKYYYLVVEIETTAKKVSRDIVMNVIERMVSTKKKIEEKISKMRAEEKIEATGYKGTWFLIVVPTIDAQQKYQRFIDMLIDELLSYNINIDIYNSLKTESRALVVPLVNLDKIIDKIKESLKNEDGERA